MTREEKSKAHKKAWREANKDKKKAYDKEYRLANKENIKAYYIANKEKISAMNNSSTNLYSPPVSQRAPYVPTQRTTPVNRPRPSTPIDNDDMPPID